MGEAMKGHAGSRQDAGATARAAASAAGVEVDPALDLDVDVQREVLAFAAQLDLPYHEILGVPRDADERAIKRAYFALSKRLHPDRYFRRDLGPFGPLLERCFQRLLEAYELLSDPVTRREVQRELETTPPSASSACSEERRVHAAAAARRLRERARQLGGRQQAERERQAKAQAFFDSGMEAFGRQRWLEAAGSVRLAIAFDPGNEAFRQRFVEVQRRAHEERARDLVRRAESALDLRDYGEALAFLEEASALRPADADLHHRTARLAWQAEGDLKKAKALAQSACDIAPDCALYRRTLGQIYATAGFTSNARRELKEAVRLDPQDRESKAALRSL